MLNRSDGSRPSFSVPVVCRGASYVSSELDALNAKVEAFTQATFALAQDQMQCGRGCHSCCTVWLTVDQVEADQLCAALRALPNAARAQVRARGALQLTR